MSAQKTCLIIGAGPAGLALARVLQPHAQVIVVDNTTPAYGPTRTLALAYDGCAFLESYGVSVQGAPIQQVTINRKNGAYVSFSAEQANLPFLGKNVVFSELHKSLIDEKNIQYFFNTPGTLIKKNIWHYAHIQADYVFITTGHASELAQVLDVAVFEEPLHQTGYIQPVSCAHTIAHQRFSDHTWAYLPTPFGGQIIATGKLDAHTFEKIWQEQFLDIDPYTPIDNYITYPLSVRTIDKQAGKDWAFFGACAHHFSPVAAQGFNLTLRDLKLFAELLEKGIDLALKKYGLIAPYKQKNTVEFANILTRKPNNKISDMAMDAILTVLPFTGWLKKGAQSL